MAARSDSMGSALSHTESPASYISRHTWYTTREKTSRLLRKYR
jgi:hypothetical protein